MATTEKIPPMSAEEREAALEAIRARLDSTEEGPGEDDAAPFWWGIFVALLVSIFAGASMIVASLMAEGEGFLARFPGGVITAIVAFAFGLVVSPVARSFWSRTLRRSGH